MSKQSIVMDQATFKNVVKRQHKALQQKGNAPSLMELQQSLAKALGFKDLHAAQKAWEQIPQEQERPASEQRTSVDGSTLEFRRARREQEEYFYNERRHQKEHLWEVAQAEMLRAGQQGVNALRQLLSEHAERFSAPLLMLKEREAAASEVTLLADLLREKRFDEVAVFQGLGVKVQYSDLGILSYLVDWSEAEWAELFERYVVSPPVPPSTASAAQKKFHKQFVEENYDGLLRIWVEALGSETGRTIRCRLSDGFSRAFLALPFHDVKKSLEGGGGLGVAVALVKAQRWDLVQHYWEGVSSIPSKMKTFDELASLMNPEGAFALASASSQGRDWLLLVDQALGPCPSRRNVWAIAAARNGVDPAQLSALWSPQHMDEKQWVAWVFVALTQANRNAFEAAREKCPAQFMDTGLQKSLEKMSVGRLKKSGLLLMVQALDHAGPESLGFIRQTQPLESRAKGWDGMAPVWGFLNEYTLRNCEEKQLDLLPLVEALLERGAFVSGIDHDAKTVLHRLVPFANLPHYREMLELLKEKGADLKAMNLWSITPWQVALKQETFRSAVVESLLPSEMEAGSELTIHGARERALKVFNPSVWEWLMEARQWSPSDVMEGVVLSLAEKDSYMTGLQSAERDAYERAKLIQWVLEKDLLAHLRASSVAASRVGALPREEFRQIVQSGWKPALSSQGVPEGWDNWSGQNQRWWELRALGSETEPAKKSARPGR